MFWVKPGRCGIGLVLLVCVLGCRPPVGSSPAGSGEGSGEGVTQLPGPILPVPPPLRSTWPYVEPKLDVPELVRGAEVALSVWAQGPGATITFLQSTVGMGAGPCDEVEGDLCVGLLEPTVLAVVEADSAGNAQFILNVEANEFPGVRFFQVAVWDPALGRGRLSSCKERYVALSPGEASVAFTLETSARLLGGTYTDGNSHTGGTVWFDYNGDYWSDLFISNGGGLHHFLYRNNGDGTFTDVSALISKPDIGLEDAGGVAADIDNDGDVDLFVPVDNSAPMNVDFAQPRDGGPNLLYVNRGDGTFEQAAEQWGLVDPEGRRTITAAFGDVDNDGLVDLYLGNWAMNSEPVGVQDNFGRLMANVGGEFEDVTLSAGGVDNDGLDNLVSVFVDIDQDGDPDLYSGNVAKTYHLPESIPDDRFYRNVGGGQFEEETPFPVGLDAWAAMGIDIGDIDGDLDWDLYITDNWETDPLPRGNPLYLGDGGTLQPNTCTVASLCTGYSAWPTNFVDFDRDGWVDVWVGTQFRSDPELVLINLRDGTFVSHTVPTVVDNAAHGGSVADYDGDGDVDIAVHNTGGDSNLYNNVGLDGLHWVEFKLLGVSTNRDGIGAMVRIFNGAHGQIRRVSGGDSAHSQSENILHFGLGNSTTIETVEVLWPSGNVSLVNDVPADKLWFISEADGMAKEFLPNQSVVYDEGDAVLTVSLRSTFGGRTLLTVTGFGALAFDVTTGTHALSFPVVGEPPTEIEVVGDRGDRFVVAVDVVP